MTPEESGLRVLAIAAFAPILVLLVVEGLILSWIRFDLWRRGWRR